MEDGFVGTLSDTQILEMAQKGKLITERFARKNVKQACYELRAGNIYYDLNNGGKKVKIGKTENDFIHFRPHQRIVIITQEKLELPADILARILTKGSLFSVGILPVNTYADPGFVGRLGIVLHNASNNHLKIHYGAPIAKIEFDKLQHKVNEVYHGQHGFESSIWPINDDYIIPKSELKRYMPNYDQLSEIESAFGPEVAAILKRIYKTERKFLITTVLFLIVNMVIIGLAQATDWLEPTVSIILGIVSNLLFEFVVFFISTVRGGKK